MQNLALGSEQQWWPWYTLSQSLNSGGRNMQKTKYIEQHTLL